MIDSLMNCKNLEEFISNHHQRCKTNTKQFIIRKAEQRWILKKNYINQSNDEPIKQRNKQVVL